MDRLLVVRCPELLEEDEGGAVLRAFAGVIAAVEAYCPWVTPVRAGICSLPARGPARYFGGEGALADLVQEAAGEVTPAEVGVADGLFAAVLAARRGLIVPAGGTPAFLAPLPVAMLGQDDLTELLVRLGIRTLGGFAALPDPHVLARFGADGSHAHRVAGGRSGELDDLRQPRVARLLAGKTAEEAPTVAEPGFWGGVSDADARASRCLAAAQELLGPDAVVMGRLQGGRGPAERARFVPGPPASRDGARSPGRARVDGSGAPWPGRIPPRPRSSSARTLSADLADARGAPVRVSARGLLTTAPARLSVAGGPWAEVRVGRAVAVRRAVVVGPAPARPDAGRHRPGRPPAHWSSGAAGGSRPPTTEAGATMALRRAALPFQLQLPRRRLATPRSWPPRRPGSGSRRVALTDHDGLYGVVRFAEAARAVGLPTVFGAELTLVATPTGPDRPHRRRPTRPAPTWWSWPATPTATPA